MTLNRMWKYYDRELAMGISADELRLMRHEPKTQSYVATGPSYHYESEFELFKDLASVWRRSSLQMHRLCEANNIKYFHFLQPNQYVVGSKIMEEEELSRAVVPDHAYKNGVERGYPFLIKAGEELAKEGVRFHDLTMIFVDVEEPLYIDDCCHINERGNEMVASVIGKTITQELASAEGGRVK